MAGAFGSSQRWVRARRSAWSCPCAPQSPRVCSMSKRILVVEDQEDLRAILRDFLSASGYTVIEAVVSFEENRRKLSILNWPVSGTETGATRPRHVAPARHGQPTPGAGASTNST